MSSNKPQGAAVAAAAAAAASRLSSSSTSSYQMASSAGSGAARGKGGKGEAGGKGVTRGKGGKGGKGETPPAAASEALAASNAGITKVFTENAAAFEVLSHEGPSGQICTNIRDMSRRLSVRGA